MFNFSRLWELLTKNGDTEEKLTVNKDLEKIISLENKANTI